MILLIAIPAAFIAATLIAGWLYEFTAVGNHIDRLLLGAPAEDAIVYDLADLYDLDLSWMMDGDL